MLKINYYRLFLFIALFSNSSNVLCSSLKQPANDQSRPSMFPRTNPPPFVCHMPTHNNTNFDSLPNGLLPTNASNMQQGVPHPKLRWSFIFNGPNFINVNNNAPLLLIPCEWHFNVAGNTLPGANNNTLPSTLPNATAALTNTNSVVAPGLPLPKPGNIVAPSFSNANTIHNSSSLPIPNESIPSNIMDASTHTNNSPISSVAPPKQAAEADEDHVLAENNRTKKKKYTKIYTCPTCHKNLASQDLFNDHLRTHSPNRGLIPQCHICHKSFTLKSGLKIHLKRHNNEKPFECDLCSKCFTTKGERTQHRRTHTGEKPFKCTHCHKCFTTSSTLTNHIRTHTGKKPYKCHICGKGLSSKRVLEGHLNKHNGKKPYKCKKCTKSYATKDGLKSHKKKHNNSQQYTCNYCGADFIYQSEYKNHMRYEEETDEELKCHRCKKAFMNKYGLSGHNKRIHSKT